VPTLIPSNAHRTGTGKGTSTSTVQVLILYEYLDDAYAVASLASDSLENRTWMITSGERPRGCVRETLKPPVAYLKHSLLDTPSAQHVRELRSSIRLMYLYLYCTNTSIRRIKNSNRKQQLA
jgi:hypothetical protein